MKTNNLLINSCAGCSIVLGLNTMWSMIKLGLTGINIDFSFYIIGAFGFVIGLLTLFREKP